MTVPYDLINLIFRICHGPYAEKARAFLETKPQDWEGLRVYTDDFLYANIDRVYEEMENVSKEEIANVLKNVRTAIATRCPPRAYEVLSETIDRPTRELMFTSLLHLCYWVATKRLERTNNERRDSGNLGGHLDLRRQGRRV